MPLVIEIGTHSFPQAFGDRTSVSYDTTLPKTTAVLPPVPLCHSPYGESIERRFVENGSE